MEQWKQWALDQSTTGYLWLSVNYRDAFIAVLLAIALGYTAHKMYLPVVEGIKNLFNFRQHWRRIRSRWRGLMAYRESAKTREREDTIIADAITDVLEQLSNFGLIRDKTKYRWYRHLGREQGITSLIPRKLKLSKQEIEFKKQLSRKRMEKLLVEHCAKLPGYNEEVTADYLAWRNQRHAAVSKPKEPKQVPAEAHAASSAAALVAKYRNKAA